MLDIAYELNAYEFAVIIQGKWNKETARQRKCIALV